MRKKLLAANWKMYKTPEQTRDFFVGFVPLVADTIAMKSLSVLRL